MFPDEKLERGGEEKDEINPYEVQDEKLHYAILAIKMIFGVLMAFTVASLVKYDQFIFINRLVSYLFIIFLF